MTTDNGQKKLQTTWSNGVARTKTQVSGTPEQFYDV
jgi:hypothetical protein